jgi:UDP-N-acetylmuramyl pentapeptide synthase
MYDFLKKSAVLILTWEARLVLARYKPKIIAVTGSVGKTTTKDAIYAVLTGSLYVRKSEKSFNSDIGVPLTILGLENAWRSPWRWVSNALRGLWLCIAPSRGGSAFGGKKYPEWLVLEVGADRPGDIRNIARWLKPDIVVLTGVPDVPVHVEFFSSPEEVILEKRSLAEYMKENGTLIINGDDTRMLGMCAEYAGSVVTYGLGRQNNFSASHQAIAYEKKKPTGIRFKAVFEGVALPVSISGVLGAGRVYAALAAFAVARIVGVNEASIAGTLSGWTPPPGRMHIIPGVNGSTIIDDTYNSSPAAALSALDTLKETKAARRIAMLGDMLELGRYSVEAHRGIGTHVASFADMLITIGFRSRTSGEAALDAGMTDMQVREYEQSESRRAGRDLRGELKEGDVVLVKGSQSMRMERTVEELMADPEQASEVLVRQEPEWLLKN